MQEASQASDPGPGLQDGPLAPARSEIYDLGLIIRTAIEDDTPFGRQCVGTLIHVLGKQHIQQHTPSPASSPAAENKPLSPSDQALLDKIHSTLANGNTKLAEIARVVDYSSYHLARLFKRFTGQSLRHYIILIRVEKARQMILEGLALGDIATQVGFYDQSHLTRHFKRMMGVTPGDYARTQARMQERTK
jgi:AraC family transcriptional regulator